MKGTGEKKDDGRENREKILPVFLVFIAFTVYRENMPRDIEAISTEFF
jgi:hypothetical protein